jgi:hypothetical protein
MRSIAAAELARMTSTAVESMNDRCDLYTFTGGQDSTTGEVKSTWDSGHFSIACGFVEASELMNERGEIITIDADAILRVPYGQAIGVKDKISARSKIYQVDGVTPGRNVQIAQLKEIKI